VTGSPWIPVLVVFSSLLPGLFIFFLGEQRVKTRTVLNLSGAVLKLVLIVYLIWGVYHGVEYEVRFLLAPGLAFVLDVTALPMLFVTLSAVLWLLTTLYAIGYLEGSPYRSRFFGFFSICVSATTGVAMAGNLFTFLIFYEALTLSTYPLVVHRGTPESIRAGKIYLAYTLFGGAVLLAGIVWLTALAGSVDFTTGGALGHMAGETYGQLRWIFWVLLLGLGVKAALLPLHGWLPIAMVAPAPVSALLHAVAVVKAGAYGIVRVLYDVYGIIFSIDLGLTQPLVWLASATIVWGSIRALQQTTIKSRLAYSTVSQVSYIALGMALAGPLATIGGLVHLVHQGIMKITLFFCAGNFAEVLKVHRIEDMKGIGRRMPLTMAAFTVAAFGMIGAPPMAGFISKWYLGTGAVDAGQEWILLVLVGSTALNAAYFLPLVAAGWFGRRDEPWLVGEHPGDRWEAPLLLLIPPVITGALAFLLGLLANVPFSALEWSRLIAERAY
jgi:multicomponent Na+:H+ antiporter subunit D